MKDAAIIGLLLVIAGLGFFLERANYQTAEFEARVDSIRSEELLQAAEAAGWEAAVAMVEEDLNGRLMAQADSNDALSLRNADLARKVEVLGGQLREMTSMYAQAVGQIEAHGEVHISETASIPDSVTAPVDDGLLSGRLVYRPPTQTLAIDPYTVTLALTTGIIELPNGQWTTITQADDPRVELGIIQSVVDPPEPVPYCSTGQKIKYGGYGAGVTALLAIVFGGAS